MPDAVSVAMLEAKVNDWLIDAEHLARHFGRLVAVRDVSLQVGRGEIFGVLGPNGAGKSTIIRMLCGILTPTSGTGSVVGYDIVREAELIKQNIGYMTQRFSLYEDLTVEENLAFYAGIYAIAARGRGARLRAAMERNGLTERRRQLVGTLSGGWKQRVALASATIHQPPLLFLDEPTAGVDPVSRREFWEQIHRLAAGDTTVVVTTHYMDEAERCHRLAFIFGGALLDVGTPQQIVERRHLDAAELHVEQPALAAKWLRQAPQVEEVSHYGHVLRVCTKGGVDARRTSCERLATAGLTVNSAARVRVTVEDAFVAMVRADGAAGDEEGGVAC